MNAVSSCYVACRHTASLLPATGSRRILHVDLVGQWMRSMSQSVRPRIDWTRQSGSLCRSLMLTRRCLPSMSPVNQASTAARSGCVCVTKCDLSSLCDCVRLVCSVSLFYYTFFHYQCGGGPRAITQGVTLIHLFPRPSHKAVDTATNPCIVMQPPVLAMFVLPLVRVVTYEMIGG